MFVSPPRASSILWASVSVMPGMTWLEWGVLLPTVNCLARSMHAALSAGEKDLIVIKGMTSEM